MQRVSLCAFRRDIRTGARLSHYIELELFLGKIVQIYTHVLIILNTIVYAKVQPVYIQTKHKDTSQTFPLHLVIFRKIVQIYTHVLIILNTIFYTKGQPVCIQTKHQNTSQALPIHLVIFMKNGTNIYPFTNNIKFDSLCKGSACVHSDETSGHETDIPITFSYF
jgi:hypothetical protein